MSMFKSHIVLMFAYALVTAVFFAFLWKETKQERIRLFLVIFCSLFVGGVVLAWLMFPFPLR